MTSLPASARGRFWREVGIAAAVLLASASGVSVHAATQTAEAEPLYEDSDFGRQMTVAEIRRDVVGNSLVWEEGGTKRVRYIASDGGFVGGRAGLRWHFRDYDNLFCVDSGDPATSGCVQFLRSGQRVTWRRKDGLIELTATIEQGQAGSP